MISLEALPVLAPIFAFVVVIGVALFGSTLGRSGARRADGRRAMPRSSRE